MRWCRWAFVALALVGCGRIWFDPIGDVEDGAADAPSDTADAPSDAALSAIAQRAYVKASNTEMRDGLGYSVALSTDGSTLAVGAYTEDSAATGIGGNQADNAAVDSGAVYVFTRAGTTWTQQAYVKASNAGFADQFGYSVALSADGSTLAVGATGERSAATGIGGNQTDDSAAGAGAVYVFTRAGATWTQQAYVKASNTDANDLFGYRVALSADGSTLAAGARFEDSAAAGIGGNQADNTESNAGAVYVFHRSGTTWTQEAYVKASNTDASDEFGGNVTLSADGSTLAVGALSEDSAALGVGGAQADNSAPNAGAVYVFTRTGTIWTQQAYVKASNAEAGDLFSEGVAVSDDGSTLAVGALSEDSSATGIDGIQSDNTATSTGAVYVFTRTGTTWSQEAYVKASAPGMGDRFGEDLTLSADGSTMAVAAYAEDSAATGIGGNQADETASSAGAVYLFTRATTWSQASYIKASNTGMNDAFGFSIALSADASTLAVGAYLESSAATGVGGNEADNTAGASGAVYVFQ
jgi:hypothetical protein